MPSARKVHMVLGSKVACGIVPSEISMTREIHKTTCSNCLIALVRNTEQRMVVLGIRRREYGDKGRMVGVGGCDEGEDLPRGCLCGDASL